MNGDSAENNQKEYMNEMKPCETKLAFNESDYEIK
jgi:hypothetical protein